MEDGMGFADIRQELVAQAFPFASALHQPGNIHHFEGIGYQVLGFDQIGQAIEPLIGNRDGAHIGLDGTKWKIRSLGPGIGQAIKEGGLAYIGKSYDTALKGHGRKILGVKTRSSESGIFRPDRGKT
jgi:hypothetical protein